MLTLDELIAAKRREAASASAPDVREVRPAVRDFAYYCATSREELAVLPLLAARLPAQGEIWPGMDAAAEARRLAGGSAHALAVATDARFGGSMANLAAAAAADASPVLRYDFLLSPADLYVSRVLGADAVWLHAFLYSADALAELIGIATSLHMAAVVGVRDRAELAKVQPARPRFIGVHADDLLGGEVDLEAAARLCELAAETASPVVLGGVTSEAELAALHGVADAVVVAAPLAARADLDAIIDRVNAD